MNTNKKKEESINWKTQSSTNPLFEDILWNRPVNKQRAGKLLLIIGTVQDLLPIHEAFQVITNTGVGEYRFVLPRSAKELLRQEGDEFIYCNETPSGSLAKSNKDEIATYEEWADVVAVIHPPGKNTETLSLLESFLLNSETPLVLTSEVLDHFRFSMKQILRHDDLALITTVRNLQSIIKELDYPFALLQRGSIPQYIETGHKFMNEFGEMSMQIIREKTIITLDKGRANITQVEAEVRPHILASLSTMLWLHNKNTRYKAITTAAFLASKEKIQKHINEKYN